MKTQIALFATDRARLSWEEECSDLGRGGGLIEVLRKSCVWLACQGWVQSVF